MKTLVKRRMRPYHLELGCVEAYGDDDNTQTQQGVRVEVDVSPNAQGDSIRVSGDVTRFEVTGTDTTFAVPTQVDTTVSKQDFQQAVKEEEGYIAGKASGGFWDWVVGLISDEDT